MAAPLDDKNGDEGQDERACNYAPAQTLGRGDIHPLARIKVQMPQARKIVIPHRPSRAGEYQITKPTGRHRIGYREVFDQVGREDVVGFVRRHYVPNNCFVVITGDVETEGAIAAVAKIAKATMTSNNVKPAQEDEKLCLEYLAFINFT